MSINATKRALGHMRIATHSGNFHADEALACFMLRLLPRFADAEIVRTRDPQVLETCDVVVDVGGVYDPANLRFDHHQRGFQETLSETHRTKLSSAGLIYKHFGREIISSQIQAAPDEVERVFFKLYESFMESIDAIDNGIEQYEAAGPPRYRITTDLSSRVGALAPHWNDKDQDMDKVFPRAIEITGEEFMTALRYYGCAWIPARKVTAEAIHNRFNVDPSGVIIVLDGGSCPWRSHLLTLEQDLQIAESILYCVFGSGNDWRVQAVPVAEGSFESRKALPEPWRGVRDEALSKLSGISDCVFVHANGFIGGTRSKETAIEMARKAAAWAE
eukprot:c35026_g1_i1.p1 GENE.c35026_g1_i1~~c35026_g1_i1.p1  ORF type:complete len:340 (-),score=64.48 c35026_g1_i1:26-1021(-)